MVDLVDMRGQLRANAKAWIARFYRHEVLVARAVRGIQADAVAEFRRTVVEPIVRQLAGGLAGFDRRGADIIVAQTPELARLIREVEATVRVAIRDLQANAKAALRGVVKEEVDWLQDSFRKELGQAIQRPISLPRIEAAVDQRPYLGGSTEEWFRSLLEGDNGVVDNVRFAVQTGVQRGLSTDEIVRTVRGSKASGYSDGLLTGTNERQVYAMVRTAATHASAMTRMEVLRELGVERWRFVAVLDSRTSIPCAANDGKTFPLGEGPIPPLHPNCRSNAVPDLGEPIGNRASVDGAVPATTDFRTWLEDQPTEVQDEVLGPTRAAAWRAGSLSFDDMLGRDMLPLPVAELRRRDLLDED